MFRWTIHANEDVDGCCCATAAVQHEVYAFVRFCYEIDDWTKIDAHVFNTVSLRRRKLTTVTTGREGIQMLLFRGNPKMNGHTAVQIEYIVYVWGGPPPYCNVLCAFDVETHSWSKPRVSGAVPEERAFHSACALGKVMYIHGGRHSNGTRYDDTYMLDTATMVWSLIHAGVTPPPDYSPIRSSATIIGTKMYVFGSYIRVFDTETNCWLNTPSAQPCPSGGYWLRIHSAFAYNGELYITGLENRLTSVLWKFNPQTFSWKRVEPKGKGPPARTYWGCCCVAGDRIILFGRNLLAKTGTRLQILDLSPSLKTLCKLAVIQYDLEASELPHDIRWELAAMTASFARRA